MVNVYAPARYELKSIGILIKDKTVNEKAEIKAKELAKVKLPKNFTHNSINVEIIEQPYWTIKKGKTLLVVIVRASKNGQSLNVDDGVFEYLNPPIMVPDGTFHKITRKFGDEIDIANYVEDPDLVLKEIIVETIRVLNKGGNFQ